MPENNQILSVEGQLVGMPLAGPESFSQQQLDYLKRALGVDETVLWEATALSDHATSCNLSESVTNFEQIQVVFQTNNDNTFYCNYPGDTSFIPVGTVIVGNNTTVIHKYAQFSITNGGLTLTRQYCCEHSNANNPSASDVIWLYKVVGIHRISGGN